MQDTALYQYLLGLQSPWTVSRVNLDVNGQRVDVWAEHPEDAAWVCPHCTKTLPLYDHAEERTWRHLDSCQFQTYLHARIPRVACGEHGVVQVTGAVGGAAVAVHAVVRAPRHRRAASMRRERGHADLADQLGRGVGADGSGRSRVGEQRKARRSCAGSASTRRRRPRAIVTSRWSATWTRARWSTSPKTARRRVSTATTRG